MKQLILSTILSSCFPLFLCQLTDEFAAPTSGLTESHISHYDDSQTHSQTDYDILSSQYGIPSTKLQLITKNVYVHIPPDEPAFQSTQTFEKRIPKKHYNIIFIKAPTPPTPTVPVIPDLSQDEHKTLVYVLVKKPESLPSFELPQPKTTDPSKPEVFFVKYKGSTEQ